MQIYCVQCEGNVEARLTDGEEIYPHRPDLYSLPFWKCDVCKNFTGCHHKTTNRTRPLGSIPTVEVRHMRRRIHAILDPIWGSGKISRRKVYAVLSTRLGFEYHTAQLRSIEDGEKVLSILAELRKIV